MVTTEERVPSIEPTFNKNLDYATLINDIQDTVNFSEILERENFLDDRDLPRMLKTAIAQDHAAVQLLETKRKLMAILEEFRNNENNICKQLLEEKNDVLDKRAPGIVTPRSPPPREFFPPLVDHEQKSLEWTDEVDLRKCDQMLRPPPPLPIDTSIPPPNLQPPPFMRFPPPPRPPLHQPPAVVFNPFIFSPADLAFGKPTTIRGPPPRFEAFPPPPPFLAPQFTKKPGE
ncbi:unnamed protein product [Caenorhabditis auriculariae]|uniref:Uncharacterized protein n=1 Tax=Caenorhabditis auriculariae TaxID=2777116 RepID=A0A8S1GM94_9PELO|nr:unnamed protein product [Caenorhabditis auriculariae]